MVQSTNDLQTLSISSCVNLVKNFFFTQDSNGTYKNLTRNSEGIFLIRWLSTILSTISYKIVSGVRECFINTATLLSSVTGIAVNLGYSVFRGSNQKRSITITPIQSMTIPKFSIIGTYSSDYDIINLEDLVLEANTPTEIKSIIGKIKTKTLKAATSDLKVLTFYQEGISEDFVLLKDGIEVPTSKYAKDLANDKYWVRTNPFGSVDLLYLNTLSTAQHTYTADTIFTVKYVELEDVPLTQYSDSMFTYFTLTNTRVIDQYEPAETVEKIKVTAPYHHETQTIIRTKKDYPKRLPEIITSITASDYNVLIPAIAQVSYLKSDKCILTDAESTLLIDTLGAERGLGIPLPDLEQAMPEKITLNISVKTTNTLLSLEYIEADINNIIQTNYSDKLKQTVDLYDIENYINSLSYVKYARVSLSPSSRTNNTAHEVGDIITNDSVSYKITDILGVSANSEPTWNIPLSTSVEVDTGLDTVDNNEIVWRTYKRLSLDNIQQYGVDSKYKIGDFVYSTLFENYMFKVVNLKKESGASVPESFVSGSYGDYVVDNELLWVRKLLNSSNTTYVTSTRYSLGDEVKYGTFSFEVVGFVGKTNTTTVTYERPLYAVFDKGSDYFTIEGDYTTYFTAGEVIRCYDTLGESAAFSVDTVVLDSGNTKINVLQTVNLTTVFENLEGAQKGTADGEVFCKILDSTDVYSSNWKTYNRFDLNVSLI